MNKIRTKKIAARNLNRISRCGPNQFNCKSDPSSCIDLAFVCDSIYDCSDRSDELDCSPLTHLRNRTKKDDMAANKLAKFIGLLNETLYPFDARNIYI